MSYASRAGGDRPVESEEVGVSSGSLGAAGRADAIRYALPIVGRFFQKSGGQAQTRRGIGVQATDATSLEDVKLLLALRLRVAIAVAEDAVDTIENVIRQPTFRYARRHDVSEGYLAGSLDVGRLAQYSVLDGGPPIYPVSSVVRSSETPENMLVAYAAIWALDILQNSARSCRPPAGAPEVAKIKDLSTQLRSYLFGSVLNSCREDAKAIYRRGSIVRVLDQVQSRLRRREIARPDPYIRVLNLVARMNESQPSGMAGDEEWSFYSESFDPRLYELWSAFAVASAISSALAVSLPDLNMEWSGSGLAFEWERPIGKIELYMQRGPRAFDKDWLYRWQHAKGKRPIGGLPDILIRVKRREGGDASRLVIIDAKLRQRSGRPTEELYKVLGYFNNFDLEDDAHGVILYHDPIATVPVVDVYESNTGGGKLISTALNPSSQNQFEQGLVEVADMITSLLGLPPLDPDKRGSPSGEDYIDRLLDEMREVKAQLVPATLDSSRRRIEVLIGGEVWASLDSDCQDMLATGEQVGFLLDRDDADFSGPVLSVIKPLEVILHNSLWLPALKGSSDFADSARMTLGQVVSIVLEGLAGKGGERGALLRDYVKDRGLDEVLIRQSMMALREINRDFRTRSAHKEKMSWGDWSSAFNGIISNQGVLKYLVEALDS